MDYAGFYYYIEFRVIKTTGGLMKKSIFSKLEKNVIETTDTEPVRLSEISDIMKNITKNSKEQSDAIKVVLKNMREAMKEIKKSSEELMDNTNTQNSARQNTPIFDYHIDTSKMGGQK